MVYKLLTKDEQDKGLIDFFFEDIQYLTSIEAYELNTIIKIPDGRYISPTVWIEVLIPLPTKFKIVPESKVYVEAQYRYPEKIVKGEDGKIVELK